MSDEDRRANKMAETPPELRGHFQRILEAEDRVKRGIGVRHFHVSYRGLWRDFPAERLVGTE